MAKSYDEDEDYYDQQADKDDFRKYGKPRHKESRSSEEGRKHRRGDVQDFMNEVDRQQEENAEAESVQRRYLSIPSSPSPIRCGMPNPIAASIPQHHEHHFGPNTVEFKGIKIDFDGVQTFFPITGHQGGFQTYGIKFVFTGKNAFYKIVWYGTDKTGRDVDLATAEKKKGAAL
jgi:hypothetical protein